MVSFLDRSGKVEVMGAAGEFSAEFVRSLALHPDIALVDTALSDGLMAVRCIRQIAPWVRIVALALAEREDDVMTWVEFGCFGIYSAVGGPRGRCSPAGGRHAQ